MSWGFNGDASVTPDPFYAHAYQIHILSVCIDTTNMHNYGLRSEMRKSSFAWGSFAYIQFIL